MGSHFAPSNQWVSKGFIGTSNLVGFENSLIRETRPTKFATRSLRCEKSIPAVLATGIHVHKVEAKTSNGSYRLACRAGDG